MGDLSPAFRGTERKVRVSLPTVVSEVTLIPNNQYAKMAHLGVANFAPLQQALCTGGITVLFRELKVMETREQKRPQRKGPLSWPVTNSGSRWQDSSCVFSRTSDELTGREERREKETQEAVAEQG